MFSPIQNNSHRRKAVLSGLVLFCLNLISGHSAAVADDQDLYRLGTVHYQRGQWEFAIGRFEELLKTTENPELKSLGQFYLAESLVATRRYAEAQRQLEAFLSGTPQPDLATRARFRLGEVSFLIGDRESALRHLSEFASAHPEHRLLEFALPYLGELHTARGELTAAREKFEEALRLFPDGELAHESRFGLARILEKNESLTEATRFYRYLIDHPESGRAADSRLQLGKLCFRQSDYDQAEKWLEAFVDLHPAHELIVPALYWLGRTRFAQQDFSAAEASYLEALRKNPNNEVEPAIRYELARSLAESQRYADALVHLNQLRDRSPQSEWADDALLLNIQILRNNEQFAAVIPLCQDFLRTWSDSPLRLHVLESEAESYFGLERFEAAESRYRFLLEEAARDESGRELERTLQSTWRYKLAVSLIKRDETRAAQEILERIELEDCSAEIRSAVCLALATIQIDQQRHSAAIRNLIRYVEENPAGAETTRCIIDISLLLARSGNHQRAAEWVERIAALPLRAETLRQMADLAFENQQFRFAADWYGQAAELADDDGDRLPALMGQVWSHQKLGEIETTIRLAGELAEQFPESDQGLEALYLVGVLGEGNGRRDEAIQAYETLVERYPRSSHYESALLSLVGFYRAAHPEKLETLIQPLSGLIAGSSSQRVDLLMYELAWILKDRGDAERAGRCFSELAERYTDSPFADEAALQAAIFEQANADVDSATRRLKKLASAELDAELEPLVDYQLGQVLFEQEEFAEAATWFQSVANDYPRFRLAVEARYWAAESHYRAGQWPEAAESLELLTHHSDITQELLERGLLRLGQTRVKLQQWYPAIEAAERLIEISQDGLPRAQAQFVIGRSHAGLGLFTQARTAYQAVLDHPATKETETAAMAQWLIGEAWFHQEKLDEAIDAYQRTEILHAFPQWQAAALLQAAKCFERKSQFDYARENYQRLVAEYSATEFAEQARQQLQELSKNATRKVDEPTPSDQN